MALSSLSLLDPVSNNAGAQSETRARSGTKTWGAYKRVRTDRCLFPVSTEPIPLIDPDALSLFFRPTRSDALALVVLSLILPLFLFLAIKGFPFLFPLVSKRKSSYPRSKKNQ